MLVRCESCMGRKTVIGLGNVPIKCPNCKGVGFVECTDIKDIESQDVDLSVDIVNEVPMPSKKELQSAKMKEAWAKRKAKQA